MQHATLSTIKAPPAKSISDALLVHVIETILEIDGKQVEQWSILPHNDPNCVNVKTRISVLSIDQVFQVICDASQYDTYISLQL